ncbi:DUF4145 domain-containing protein [Mesorhizobium sp. M0152]|uniref:DUF4145 domain-containing protein n=1 Tax=Mesorhizobium sp. M0152 TaxID=2956898 RepID=UPI003334AAA9
MCGGVTYTLFECRGCNAVFYETSSWDENDVDQWYGPDGQTESEANLTKETFPKPPARPRPDWFDVSGAINHTLHGIMEETYKADEAGCHLLAAVGLRTALDSCFEGVGIEGGDTFAKKLHALKAGGYIGETEHDLLTVLIDAGSAAAHRGWTPERQHVHQLMDVLENFIQRVFVNGKRALEMKAGIPGKQPRIRSPRSSVAIPVVIAESEQEAATTVLIDSWHTDEPPQ